MTRTLFTNAALVLDGSTELQPAFNVLVQDSRIVTVSATPIDAPEAVAIDVGGRTARCKGAGCLFLAQAARRVGLDPRLIAADGAWVFRPNLPSIGPA
jgi:hypothetical protein